MSEIERIVPKNATQGNKKYKVTLAGKGADVSKAKEAGLPRTVLESIRKYGYHELTHPGQTHEEMEIEAWAYKHMPQHQDTLEQSEVLDVLRAVSSAYSFMFLRYLIGKAGSELRHIQNNYKAWFHNAFGKYVKVNIPRDHSACQNVVVVGDPVDVSRAKDYIDNLMWKAQNAPTGRCTNQSRDQR
eukprot:Skav221028  [mRNA]  locus=scaffold576:156550:159717:- [translate_table: standard]